MNLQEIKRALVGGAVIYVAMAACSASEDNGTWRRTGASDSGTGGSSMWDALSDPVPNAEAGEPTYADEPCNKTFSFGGSSQGYAEHLYPGLTKNELTLVRVVMAWDPGYAPPGYGYGTNTYTFVDDGKVAVSCTPGTTVTFVKP
jgi:hypothetical protein